MDTAVNIANYMLSKKMLSPKQVQKILYYAYSIYLIKYNDEYDENSMNKLFDDKIEAWEHGPVIRSVYEQLRPYGYSYDRIRLIGNNHLSDTKIENFINKILMVYGQYSGYELEKMTHNEAPWNLAMAKGRNVVISDSDIYTYFSNKYKKVTNN
ncbi:MAG: SocA family protein [Clostridia bacterium]|nr:SocA family protein [Clostridia bacterium]